MKHQLNNKSGRARNRKTRGSNIVEFALLAPWYIFLFVAAIDYGFYSYGLVSAQNAARVTAMYCSASSTTCLPASPAIYCNYSLDQLRGMPNIGTSVSTCTGSPLVVTPSVITGIDGANAESVTVTYTSPQMIPIPGILPGQLTISRTVQMKLQS
jgi:Flp pilus assembly protein TadG